MSEKDINITVPFKSLVSSVKNLQYEKKIELLDHIEEQLEEELMTTNLQISEEIEEARIAYKVSDYISLDEYKTRNRERLS